MTSPVKCDNIASEMKHTEQSGKGFIMAAIINTWNMKYYLHSESEKALYESEKQGSILMRTYKVNTRRIKLPLAVTL